MQFCFSQKSDGIKISEIENKLFDVTDIMSNVNWKEIAFMM